MDVNIESPRRVTVWHGMVFGVWRLTIISQRRIDLYDERPNVICFNPWETETTAATNM